MSIDLSPEHAAAIYAALVDDQGDLRDSVNQEPDALSDAVTRLEEQLHPRDNAVRPNHEQQAYVIPSADGGYSCYGFDNALDELDRVTLELVGRGQMTHKEQQSLMYRMRTHRGHLVVYVKLQQHREQLRLQCEADGERAVYNLSPQLRGFEGQVVEVEDVHDAPRRRFVVGLSTGWAPCHLEVELGHDEELEPGHDPARREYHHVEAPYEQ